MLVCRNCESKIIHKVGKLLEPLDNRRLVVLLPSLPPQAHSAKQLSLLLPTQSSEVGLRLVQTTTTTTRRSSRLAQAPLVHSARHQQPLVPVHLVVAGHLVRITSSSSSNSLPLDLVLSAVRHSSLRRRLGLARLVGVGHLVKITINPSPLERLVRLVVVSSIPVVVYAH